MKVKSLLWPIQPHTKAKHVILRNYLSCWMPIMTNGYNSNSKAVLWDGFAGPGEYLDGEDGSPLVMLKEAINYMERFPNIEPMLRFFFVEKDLDRYNNLKEKILELFNYDGLFENNIFKPNQFPHMLIYLYNENFEKSSEALIKKIEQFSTPCFAFIDPFGFKDTPYNVIKKIASNSRTEVFVNFMYEDINRFIKLESLQHLYNRLFGTEKWNAILDNIDNYSSADRRYFLHKLYKDQLNEAGFKYVISFEMKNEKNSTDYFLYFGTNHVKGLEKMKDAMWSVDNSGAYTFSDYEHNQLQLRFVEFDQPDLSILADELLSNFTGKTVTGEIVKNYIVTDTIFRKNVHANEALKILETRGDITVTNRKHSYPEKCIIRFK